MELIKIKATEEGDIVILHFSDGSSATVPDMSEPNKYSSVIATFLETNTVEEAYTADELRLLSEKEMSDDAVQYLSSTDWYITRQLETGIPVPEEITTLRAEARLKVK